MLDLNHRIFMDYDLGFFDHETGRLGTAENPFAANVFAVSMDHRNTGTENMRWGLPVQSVSRSCVQFLGHSV